MIRVTVPKDILERDAQSQVHFVFILESIQLPVKRLE